MEEKDEIVISLSDVWNIIKKNAAFIIVVTLICAIGSFFITRYFIPKLYTSSIQLYVDTSNDDENKNNLNILSEQTYAQNLVATYIKMLNTNTFYTELSEHINNKYTAKQLSEMVSFSSDEKTEIFDAKVTTSSPNDSKLIADAVGKVAPEAISRLKSKATLKIVDYAQLPTAPSSPNEIKNVIIAMIAGLVISVGISLLRAFLDKKMRYNEEMTMIGDIPILAAIPKFDAVNKSNKKKIRGSQYEKYPKRGSFQDVKLNAEAVGFQIKESYKKARTNIAYSIVKKGCKMVSITSSSKSEGKTITAVNIAIALAQQVDTRVLIIDCDLRRPRIQSVLEIPVDKGITNYLNFECEVSDIVYTSKLDNLDAICCGTIPPNPSELLSSDNMKELIKELSKQYDYIIFDTPPIGVVIDALPIIKQTDGVVVIVRDNVTDIRDYKKQLIFSNAPKLILSVLYLMMLSLSVNANTAEDTNTVTTANTAINFLLEGCSFGEKNVCK